MTTEIFPSRIKGAVTAPSSKSMAHRCLIAAALADGVSRVANIALSEDIKATVGSLRALGARIDIDGTTATVTGTDVSKSTASRRLFAGESGSTLRFMIPLCLVSGAEAELYGAPRLFARPLGAYEAICAEQGIRFERDDTSVTVAGKLREGKYELPGNVSSQFVTGLLFALPLLEGDSEIVLTSDLESRPYVDMTLSALAEFGIEIDYDGGRVFGIKGGQKYIARDTEVEGDYSNAAFFEALNLMGGDVRVIGLNENSLQGDRIYKEYFPRLTSGDPIDIGDCPDLAPILFAMAAEAGSATFTGTRRLKMKESDRGEAMKAELAKFGASVMISENSITVTGGALHAPTAPVDSHNDHRIVMAAAVLMTKYGGRIIGSEAVAKSMPDFFDRLAGLGCKMETV